MQNTNDYINSENTKRFKLQAPSSKQQAIQETVPHNDIEEATSLKPQASKASSRKRQAPSTKVQASSRKRQARGPRTLDKVSRTSDRGA